MRLVFLHALPFGGEMWRREVSLSQMPAVAPTLYTAGSSLGHWAAEAFRLAGDEPVGVVGCSVGGSVALEMARQRPDQVAGMMLVGSKAGVRPEPNVRDDAVDLIEREGVLAAWNRYWLPIFGADTPPSVLNDCVHEMPTASELIEGVRAFHDRDDLSEVAAAWSKPLMAVVGAEDRSPSPAVMKPLGEGPNRSFHVVPRSGHYVNLEQPDGFDALLDRFVSNITGQAG